MHFKTELQDFPEPHLGISITRPTEGQRAIHSPRRMYIRNTWDDFQNDYITLDSSAKFIVRTPTLLTSR